MSTSASYDFNIQRDNIIKRAYQLINVYGFDDSVSTNDNNYAIDILNGMLKVWQVEGINLWKRKIGYLFTELNVASYDLGSVSGAENATNTYVSTTLSSDAALGASTVSLTSTTGMSASDFIGIELNDGSRQWTTISGSPGSPTTLVATLTAAASSGNTVITYTTKINRPLKLITGITIDLDSTNQTAAEMAPISHDEYLTIPVKSTAGKPNNFHYSKQLDNSLPYTGKLYLYPRPNNVNHIISFSYLDSIQDMDSSTNDLDLPQEWIYPVIVNLATELAYAYGKFQELQVLEPKAQQLKEIVKYSDADDEPITFHLKRKY